MEPSTLLEKPAKPPRWWIAVTIVAGALGATAAIAIAGKGTYDVGPYRTELRARPAGLGKTELAIRPVTGTEPGRAEAGTHRAPIAFRVTIVGVRTGVTPIRADADALASPYEMASFMAEEGKDAIRSFGIKLAILSLVGGLAGGAAVSLGRWQRIVGAALAAVLTLAIVGVLVQQTYDKEEFRKTRFVPEERQPGPGPLPIGT